MLRLALSEHCAKSFFNLAHLMHFDGQLAKV
jgi:hypothetical protein